LTSLHDGISSILQVIFAKTIFQSYFSYRSGDYAGSLVSD